MPAFPRLTAGNPESALIDGDNHHSYSDLAAAADQIATALLAGRNDLQEERIAFLVPASFDYVMVLHGIWRAGGIAIPLNVASAIAELEHYLASTGVTRLITGDQLEPPLCDLCERLNIEWLPVHELIEGITGNATGALPEIQADRRAMIIFTSGTTSKPKGVVTTHKGIHAQVTALVQAWEWSDQDVIPLFLPLHHVHGIINVLCCALWTGATVHLMPKLDIPFICQQVSADTYSVFMAVPTIYVKLIDYFESLEPVQAQAIGQAFGRLRLTVSGSAACPVKLFDQWHARTGQFLLERYGMTEIGMGLSNPYRGERRAGCVGLPLPGVSVQLYDDHDKPVITTGTPGEIRIKGDNVFLEYWNNPQATRESFKHGWFCTGDVAVIEDGYYRILGRSSIDIIKSGGYKLSALEIEGVLLTHDDIREVAVIGADDDTWGEVVVAFMVLRQGATLEYADLKQWCNNRISAYKIPKQIRFVDSLPRNAMGKVTKPVLRKLL